VTSSTRTFVFAHIHLRIQHARRFFSYLCRDHDIPVLTGKQ
jgi:hypothetical protein